jgi:hypothetical protein
MQNPIKNTRIYDLNDDFEAVRFAPGWGGSGPKTRNNDTKGTTPRGASTNYEFHRQRTVQKAKSKIRRLIKRYSLFRFATLTFAENVQSVKVADAEFRKFQKRLHRRIPEFKYVAVRELQARGAVHYHLAINSYVKHQLLDEIWGQGFVWIEKKRGNRDKLSNYLCKYITKYAGDERLKGSHIYLCSQGLELPYQDEYFYTITDMMQHLTAAYGEKMKSKQVLFFEGAQIVWVG